MTFSLTETHQAKIETAHALHQIEKITEYVRFLERNPAEVEALFKECSSM